ncbi:hypothetical protein RND71_037850 [Anisodus tanguticus]|uniref:Uncharacterized protein n=1 Tax=Anisodus tanguticus TaxID=243964 RepID=A0AAE1QZL0_9SOLA|nr:hypothetical protein RND71_037850 [Anisodus tanguticus]
MLLPYFLLPLLLEHCRVTFIPHVLSMDQSNQWCPTTGWGCVYLSRQAFSGDNGYVG